MLWIIAAYIYLLKIAAHLKYETNYKISSLFTRTKNSETIQFFMKLQTCKPNDF